MFLGICHFDWHITPKKKKLGRLPKIGPILMYTIPSLWPNYIGEKRTPFSKAYGIKVKCYAEHVGENIGNLKGT
jgi:hypothetical protein